MIHKSIIRAIINAFKIVARPGFCSSGIHKIKTVTLIKNVSIPILKLVFRERPWAKTLQGEAPVKETINNPSPKPNNIKPKQQKNSVENFGLKLYVFLEVQFTFGIFFIFKNIF